MNAPSLVEDIFLAAVEKTGPEDRAAYLDEACKGDADLRRRSSGSWLPIPRWATSWNSPRQKHHHRPPTGRPLTLQSHRKQWTMAIPPPTSAPFSQASTS